MADKRQKALQALEDLKIPYTITEHPAVYTIEEMDKLPLPHSEHVVKNLFLCDAKGKRHFLVTLPKEKTADLRRIREKLGCTALRFASEERLARYLGLCKGEVSPLGVLNDDTHAVEVVLDSDLAGKPCLGVHPNDNTATVWISHEHLCAVLRRQGNAIIHVSL